MRKLISKITTVFAMVALITGLLSSYVCADEPVITYGVEFGEDTVTVTFHLSEVSSFDMGVAYDPAKLTVKEMSYTDEFNGLQLEGNTVLAVQNDVAMDDSGNTYAVFVGVGYTPDNGAIAFDGQAAAKVVFEGDFASSEIAVISGTATVDDVYTADVIGTESLNQSAGTVITPAPVEKSGTDNVTASETDSSANSDTGTENNADTNDEPASENSESADNENSSEGNEATDNQNKDTDKNDKSTASDKDSKDETKNNTYVYIIIGAAVVIVIAAVAVVLIKKRKK